MQGLILAAGMGTRLGSMTSRIPKVLIEVGGKPLIIRALDKLHALGIEETIIVVGYKKDLVMKTCGHNYKGMAITYVYNKRYKTTNNVYSLYLARDYIDDELLMVEGDLIYSVDMLRELLETDAECAILVSKYNKETMDGTIIKADDNDNAIELVVKKKQGKNYDYSDAWKTVNIYKYRKKFLLDSFLPAIRQYVKRESVNSYYEIVLGALIYYGNHDIKIVKVDEDEWFEIDDPDDYEIAKKAIESKNHNDDEEA